MIYQLIVGLIVGIIARFILPGKEALPSGVLGIVLTALLGVGGAFVGGFIAKAIWADDSYIAGWTMSIIGAILLLLLVRVFLGKGEK